MCFLSFCPQNFLYLMNFPGMVYFFFFIRTHLGEKQYFLKKILITSLKPPAFAFSRMKLHFNGAMIIIHKSALLPREFARFVSHEYPLPMFQRSTHYRIFFILLKLNKSGLIFGPRLQNRILKVKGCCDTASS